MVLPYQKNLDQKPACATELSVEQYNEHGSLDATTLSEAAPLLTMWGQAMQASCISESARYNIMPYFFQLLDAKRLEHGSTDRCMSRLMFKG
uniref:Uncharacterized protein n=1 Tax=Setaria italica TaxID=4555 RepID=K4AH84_SETIT